MSDTVRRFFTWAMLAIGALIVAFAGPCTLFFAGGAVAELVRGAGDESLAIFILVTALVVGGIPLAGGLTLVVVAFRTLRAAARLEPGHGP